MKAQKFKEELTVYLDRYPMSEHATNKLISYLLKRYDSPEDLVCLRETLGDLEKESPHFFASPGLNIFKISKEIIRNGFNIKQINGRLDKKLFIKNKRAKKDIEFNEKYPHPVNINFL